MRALEHAAAAAPQPDWLADAVTFGLVASELAERIGVRTGAAIRWLDLHGVTFVRRRPVPAAAVLAAALAFPFVVAKLVLEGYPPPLLLLSFALPAGALFAFVVLVGRHLRVVAPRPGRPPVAVSTSVVACAAGTVVFAFHDSLLGSHQTAAGLNALFFGGGTCAGAVWVTAEVARRRWRAACPR